ncbi:GTP-binding protein [Flavivirga spongiicola]|uniref:GTP-binding protein n=1 Tax=Flavivirga spongiicola TaxID=421621 RepID=A0ABU7XVS7_9FLAO|nr:GTP-binding protein [Flavivirga sp. MEBiC05379]MDO5979697.1 GTP-binding protein [Flavivirga sp. MEBiC05379]
MPTTNDVVLRPRFKIELSTNNQSVLKDFEDLKSNQSEFIVTRLDNHVFIKFPKEKQHFWSPQLHLEIDEIDDNSSLLHGLFGPNPTVWTMFMFFHFIVASLFIAFGIWAYTNSSLDKSYAIQVSLMLLMVVIWIVLYFAGSIGKASSKNEMRALNDFMNHVIESKKMHQS